MLKAGLLFVFLGFAAAASAQSFSGAATGEILSGWRESDGRHIAGLSVRLAPGWKTYWRTPGEGGIPPRFNWSGSRNLASVNVMFPIPKVLDQNGLRSIGYDRDVVFPLFVHANDDAQPVALRGEIEIGVCEEICIPMTLTLSALLPANGAPDARISDVIRNQPRSAGSFSCEIEPIPDGLRLRAVTTAPAIRAEIVVIEPSEAGIWTSPSKTKRSGQQLVAEVEMVSPTAKPFALARNAIRMTVIGEGQAVEMLGCR
ncbi:MAG: protein-disulfide reductase DsbD family protein [Paracoccaceae bacterium]|nr:protein-disulfide reductase DsbD family protein [Paracoccaceae bacterium]